VSNHSFTVSFQSSWDLPLVVFSNSEKAFSLQELEKKLLKTLRHIEHLADQICHKNTHGGKRFRTRQISLKDQIESSIERFDLLRTARVTAIIVQIRQAVAFAEQSRFDERIISVNFEENNHSVEHKGKKYNYRIIS